MRHQFELTPKKAILSPFQWCQASADSPNDTAVYHQAKAAADRRHFDRGSPEDPRL